MNGIIFQIFIMTIIFHRKNSAQNGLKSTLTLTEKLKLIFRQIFALKINFFSRRKQLDGKVVGRKRVLYNSLKNKAKIKAIT